VLKNVYKAEIGDEEAPLTHESALLLTEHSDAIGEMLTTKARGLLF
jgi:hypothetical protein